MWKIWQKKWKVFSQNSDDKKMEELDTFRKNFLDKHMIMRIFKFKSYASSS